MVQIRIPVSMQFDFEQTVLSHGWYMLAPFTLDRDNMILHTIYQLESGDVLRLSMSQVDTQLQVDVPDRELLPAPIVDEISHAVKTMLNTDWDLASFYQAMRDFDGYDWLEDERKGRILISPTIWEDLAKVLLTTNTTWAQTIQMSQRLCNLGTPHPTLSDTYAFPTPQMISELDFDTLAEQLRAGYRTAYLYELAGQIANDELDVESWRTLDSDTLYKQVKSLKGYGDYAAGTMVRMLGHFDKLAIDSACREMYATRHNNGVKGDDNAIKAEYERFGQWKGLVMWMNIMRR